MRAFIAFLLSALAVSGAESVSVGIRTNYVPVHGDIIWRSNGVWMLLGRGSDGYFLKVDGSNLVWAASTPGGGSGTVTSVGATSDVSGLSFSGSPVTISGNLGLTGILGLASGGTAGTNAATARTGLGIGTAGTNDASAFATAAHNHSGVYQPADTDLDDLADGSLTGSKVGSGIDDDNVSFDDADNLWAATSVGPALEELNDSINAGVPNGTGAKVHWSQLLGVPAGFADNSDDGSGGGSGTMTGITLTNAASLPLYFTPNSTTTSNTFTLTSSNQSANVVYAGPSSGAAAAPTFRSLVDDDVPNTITVDTATTATTATTANSGDSATAFFSSGQIERARGGTGADTSAYGAGLFGSDGSNNTIDVDTEAELETALGSVDVVTVSTDDITSANLRTALSDETGTGAAVFAGGDIGAATATTAAAGDADTSVATTAFASGLVSDTAYGAGWNGVATNAPSQNAVYDVLATKKPLSTTKYLQLIRADYSDGAGAVPQTNSYTASGLMHYTLSGSAETNANFLVYEFVVPEDLDTTVAMTAKFSFVGGGTDTDDYQFHLTYGLGSSSAVWPPTIATSPIVFNVTPASPAANDLHISSAITLTNWAGSMTVGTPISVKLARANTAQDDSARDVSLVISYGSNQ